MQDFFQFSHEIVDWRFLTAFFSAIALGLLLPDRISKPFRSIRGNVLLFTGIALAAAVGTFIPQNESFADAVTRYGEMPARLMFAVGLLDIYHSWWFSAALGFMAFNVVVCKLRRLPQAVLAPPKGTGSAFDGSASRFLAKARIRDRIETRHDAGEAARAVTDALRSRGYHVTVADASVQAAEGSPVRGRAVYGGRHYVQRWGDFVLHVSLVLILAGGFVGAFFGFEETVAVTEGGRAFLRNRPYEIVLNDFEIDYYESTGAPSLYASDIEVRSGDETLGRKRIVVNHPLDIDGVRFYQASWGMSDRFRTVRLFLGNSFLTLKPGEKVSIAGLPFSVRANSIMPSFDLDEAGRVITRDLEGRNLAVQMDFLQGDRVVGRIWALKDRPDLAFQVTDDGVRRTMAPPFRIANVDPILFSGIQVGYDPGAAVFWVGSIILLIGLCAHFYWHQRRVRALVWNENGETVIAAGGWNSRAPKDYEAEFLTIVDDIRGRVAAGATP